MDADFSSCLLEKMGSPECPLLCSYQLACVNDELSARHGEWQDIAVKHVMRPAVKVLV